MHTPFNIKPLISVVVMSTALALAGSALAQSAPARLRGTIAKVSGDSVDVVARNGKSSTVTLAADVAVMAVVKADIGDIKSDRFIGTAAALQADGTLEALEVTIFPAGMKSGEGHYPWDLGDKSSMTNGTVGDVVVTQGRVMTVKYQGGEKKITVPLEAPIVSLEPGQRALLVPGAHVVFFMKPGAGGKAEVAHAVVGKGGVVPPM